MLLDVLLDLLYKTYISMQAEAKAKIKEVFDSFDADKNGFIELHEIKKAA